MPGPLRWISLPTLLDVRAIAAHGRLLVAALDDGNVVRSPDGGLSWEPVLTDRVEMPVTLLVSEEVYLAGTTEGVVRAARADGWLPGPCAPAHVFVTALAARGEAAIAGTLRTGVFHSPDKGLHWEAAREGLPLGGERLRVYAAADAPHGLVVAHALGVSLSRDGGVSWVPAALGLPLQIPHATLASDGQALYAGVGGHLFRAGTGPVSEPGLSWTEIHDGSGVPLGLLAAAEGILFAAAETEPFLVASADEAVSWHALARGLPEPPVGLAFAAPWLVALLGDGRLWRTMLTPLQTGDGHPIELRVDLTPSAVELAFELRRPSAATLTLHDVLGHQVACLAEGWYAAGPHRVLVPFGSLPAGFYRCRLQACEASRTAPVVMLE